jgi:hypothetical protein
MTQLQLINDLQLYIAPHYNNPTLIKFIRDLENRYELIDETNYFQNLVNFSTARTEPYQKWVRYREGYSTELVKELINRSKLNTDRHFIADPMMGSGTTLLTATNLGFDSIGLDVNPYCEYLINSKLLRPTKATLDVVCEISGLLAGEIGNIEIEERKFSDYFPSTNLKAIEFLREKIEKIDDPEVKQILKVAWYVILEESSNRKKDGNGLASRPSAIKDVQEFYLNKLNEIVSDYRHFPLPEHPKYKSYLSSSFNFSLLANDFAQNVNKSLGAIVFSPPYANSFDYFESYKLELIFGDFYSQNEFSEARNSLIRNYRKGYGKEIECDIEVVELLCKEIWDAIPLKENITGKRDGRTRLVPNMLRGYFTDMRRVLIEIFNSLSVGGFTYIIVDQSAYVGKIIPTDLILAFLAEQVGFNVEYISKCRKANTSGQQIKAFPYLKETLRESIVVLSKD